MHIWYIHPYAGGPGVGGIHRPYLLARAWQRSGHSATVILSSFHHLMPDGPLAEGLRDVEGVPYLMLRARPYRGNGLVRLLNMRDFCKGLRRLLPVLPAGVAPPGAIIVSSPHPFPVHAGKRLADRFGVPLVFEIRDIWPASITEIVATSRWHPFVMACARTERFAYRHADLIASVLPLADQHLASLGFGDKPFVWVPNGASLDDAPPQPIRSAAGSRAAAALERWRGEGRRIIIHTGAMGPPNGLLELVEELSGEPDERVSRGLTVLLAGSGSLAHEIEARGAAALCPIASVGEVPKSEVAALLARADIGYAGIRNIPALYRYGVSLNKVAEYLAAGLVTYLPIAPCGDAVSQSGAGIAEPAQSPRDIRSALIRLAALPPEERRRLGEKGQRYLSEHYDYDKIAARYSSAIAGCKTKRGTS